MSRIAPLDPPYADDVQQLFDLVMPEGMPPLELFRVMARSGRLLYQFEYRVDYPGLEGKDPTYTVCVVGSKDDTLYTFASRVPSAIWGTNAEALREAASSFALL